MKRAATAAAIAIALLLARESRAECTDAGACGAAQYCALPDGGAVTDGGPGKCVAEPCVVKSDCPGAGICDTSVEPHRCVGCRSTADCLSPFVCDLPTHTCVPPVGVDAGKDAGGDAGVDAAADAGGDASDAATPPPPPRDAGDAGDADIAPVADAAPPDFGSLNGGGCDCDLATGDADAAAAGAAAMALALAWLARRRSKSLR